MKKCSVCKIEKELSEFSKDNNAKGGLCYKCRVCNNEQSKKWKLNNRDKYTNYLRVRSRTTEGKYKELKDSAKKRGLEMKISFEQYKELIKENKCFYCDASLAGSAGHSLNRVDSNKGYTPKNVKICCGICNQIMSNYSIEELSSRLYKIVNRMKKLQEENK